MYYFYILHILYVYLYIAYASFGKEEMCSVRTFLNFF